MTLKLNKTRSDTIMKIIWKQQNYAQQKQDYNQLWLKSRRAILILTQMDLLSQQKDKHIKS